MDSAGVRDEKILRGVAVNAATASLQIHCKWKLQYEVALEGKRNGMVRAACLCV